MKGKESHMRIQLQSETRPANNRTNLPTEGVHESRVTTSTHTASQSGTFLHDPIMHYKVFQCRGTWTRTKQSPCEPAWSSLAAVGWSTHFDTWLWMQNWWTFQVCVCYQCPLSIHYPPLPLSLSLSLSLSPLSPSILPSLSLSLSLSLSPAPPPSLVLHYQLHKTH